MRTVLLSALAGLVSVPALAVGGLADVSIVDRDTGKTLAIHQHEGEYWVAGRPGARYAIQVNNRIGRRIEVVASVDGVDVISGATADHVQRGYVLSPWQSYSVNGWRKSDSEVAAFNFTSVPKSYAARTGRPNNVGVIGVALFPGEPPPPAAPPPPPVAPQSRESAAAEDQTELNEIAVTGTRMQGGKAADSVSGSARSSAPAPSLGTGHGSREHSSVVPTHFVRVRHTPDEVIRIRYDSHENLVAMGVIRVPRPVRPDPFPGSQRGYVPDP